MHFFGENYEKILNLAAKNGITFWNTRLLKDGIETYISVANFKRLPDIMHSSGLRVHIISKIGFPFITFKNRKRIGFIAGLILTIVFLEFMSGFIWIIEVKGNKNVDRDKILAACAEIGIKEGTSKRNINTKIQKEKLLLKVDSLAWASLNIEGSLLTVNVTEIKTSKKDSGKASNLKAKADGIIQKIDVTKGNCIVKTGDTVKKGDILVSGILEKANSTEFIHSAGSVIAVTEREITLKGKYRDVKSVENGRVKTKKVLKFFGIKIPLFLGKEHSDYNSILKEESFSLFGKSLPITLYTKEFRYKEKMVKNLNKEQLIEKLNEELRVKLKTEKIEDYEILNCDISEEIDGIAMTVIVSATENIAFSEEIMVED